MRWYISIYINGIVIETCFKGGAIKMDILNHRIVIFKIYMFIYADTIYI